ncbi:hypothetical protein [Sphingobacterium spiritivorum]|uniref:hypothetical protein n=1 Tax=Sphingobacterium spiritivorum TaxID=258 RepID=UPI0019182C6A|nr:hypothetical protein [Sphingobacterium spiritivorum]QQT27437.1 hypothetical protein I6J02_06180 [Sphingobacterium spiritivorum]
MTFEEFFVKKNIDLNALQHSNSALYDEFKKHYMLMGEKSFDHTKKFWFNRLRKDYKLAEQEVGIAAVVKKTETPIAPAASAGVASKPAGFRPKFKSAATPVTDNEPTAEKTAAEPRPATGFTPRFKSNTTTENTEPKEDSNTQPASSGAPAGFKPRFKPGVTTTKTNTEEPVSPEKENIQETSNKPAGFKPRFKAGITAPKKEQNETASPAESTATDNKETTEIPSAATAEDAKDTPQTPAKPLGFRPKFKAGVTTVKKEQDEGTSPTESAAIDNKETTETSSAATAEDTKEAPQTPAKPLGFRPKFKAGVTTVKKEQDEGTSPTESAAIDNKETTETSSAATAEDTKEAPQTPAKPLGFRPKFKAGVTTVKKEQDEGTSPTESAAIDNKETTETSSAATAEDTKEAPQTPAKPLGFRPKFKAGVTKIQKNEDNQTAED